MLVGGGGGGWGPPEDRSPSSIAADLDAEYITWPSAQRDYGPAFEAARQLARSGLQAAVRSDSTEEPYA
jgi:N-methylhydantoinase B/oxoprolinase/acetone carboxylase alpha subunit